MTDSDYFQPLRVERPRSTGPGSSRRDWQAYAYAVEDANVNMQRKIEELRNHNLWLHAELGKALGELAKLNDQKPKGGRQRLPGETVRRIKAALANGNGVRAVAKMHHVSAMTVSRYKKAMEPTSAE